MNSRFEDQASERQTAEHPVVATMRRARQGVTGHNVRYVLGFSLAGAIIVLAVVYIVYFAPYLGS